MAEVTPRSRESLAWLAGFWDGEGCVTLDKRHARPIFCLTQAGDEGFALCQRVLDVSGVLGKVYDQPAQSRKRNNKPYWRVMIFGYERVQALTAMCWPWLSDTKRSQATRALEARRAWIAQWKSDFVHHNSAKTECPHGHRYTEENTILVQRYGSYVRRCLACREAYTDRVRDEHNLVRRVRRAAETGRPVHRGQLTVDEVRQIRVGLAGGQTHKSIAAQFGTTRANIGAIATGKSWAHLQ